MFAISPISTISSPLSMSPLSPLSPLSPPFLAKTNPTTIVQAVTNLPTFNLSTNLPVFAIKPSLYIDVDTGINDSYLVQKDITKYFMYKTLDKWLYNDFSSLLKFLKVENGKVRVVKSDQERDSNDVKNDSESDLEKKSDFIHDRILDEESTRSILIRVLRELGYKWYDLPYKETVVKDILKGYLKKKLKNLMKDNRN
jgi:hypothetical protein